MEKITKQIKMYINDGKYSGGRKRSGWSTKHLKKKQLHLGFWVICLDLKTLDDLTHIAFRAKLNEMADKGKANKTISNYAEAMTSFLKWLVVMDVIEEKQNPLRKFRTWCQKVNIKTGYFTRHEFNHMMIHASEDFKLTCLTAVTTGYRRGELAALTAKCLKEYEGTYWLCLDGEFCKNGDDARQPIPIELATMLLKVCEKLKKDDPLLWVPTHTQRSIDILMREAGIEKYPEPKLRRTFHSLRDSYISWMAQNGVDIQTIKELARHSDLRITARYLHTNDERKLLAIAKLNIFKEYIPNKKKAIDGQYKEKEVS